MLKKKIKPNKKIWAIIIMVVVVFVLLGTLIGNNMQRATLKDIEHHLVQRGDLSLTVIGSGKIKSSNIERLMPTGNLSEVNVRVGDRVKNGDVLGTIINQSNKIVNFFATYDGIISEVPGISHSTYFEISNPNDLQMEIQVTEKDIHKIKENINAIIYIDALDIELEGVVSRVSLMGQDIGDLSVYDVTIKFEKSDHNIYLGMTGSARIAVDTKEDIVKIPLDALIEKNNKRYILNSNWLDNINRPQSDYYVEVKTGISDGNYVEIIEGNIENMEIIILPPSSDDFRMMMRD